MSKRFCDTELWQKEWFQDLSLKEKILVKYIFENCDCSGVWETNYRMASFIIGEKVTKDIIDNINNKNFMFEFIAEDKIYIKNFIEFQYGKLSYNCKPHLPIIKLLNKYGIEFETKDENNLTIKQTRKRLTETAKKNIFNRDKYECQYCGSHDDLEIDHIIPLSKGGTNEDDNLLTACHRCNSLKGDKNLKEFIEENKRVINFLDRVSNILKTLEEKEEEKEKEKEKEEDKEKEKEDIFVSPKIEKVFQSYEKNCPNLCKLSFERRNTDIRKKVSDFLFEVKSDFAYIERLCIKANDVKFIADRRIDFKSMLNNHIGIMNGKYEKPPDEADAAVKRLMEKYKNEA